LETNEAKLFNSLLDDEQEQDKSKTKPKKLQDERENEIMRIIRDELRLDPLNLPPIVQGKPGVKSKVKSILNVPNKLFTNKTFNTCWQELRSLKKLREEK
jgi:hypothetical protein